MLALPWNADERQRLVVPVAAALQRTDANTVCEADGIRDTCTRPGPMSHTDPHPAYPAIQHPASSTRQSSVTTSVAAKSTLAWTLHPANGLVRR